MIWDDIPTAPPGILGIDPGVDYYAHAHFLSGVLVNTGLCRFADRLYYPNGTPTAVIECPRIMPGRRVRARDVEGVLIAYGRLLERYTHVIPMDPHSVPEKIWQARVLDALSPTERTIALAQPAKVRKHTLDAIGVGLKHLGRL